jgi:hypothetical protein
MTRLRRASGSDLLQFKQLFELQQSSDARFDRQILRITLSVEASGVSKPSATLPPSSGVLAFRV